MNLSIIVLYVYLHTNYIVLLIRMQDLYLRSLIRFLFTVVIKH